MFLSFLNILLKIIKEFTLYLPLLISKHGLFFQLTEFLKQREKYIITNFKILSKKTCN
jgi:hypothetical protein